MADKSFGVKELNLLGSSGTPSIESPNDLNLNANTVAISTNLTVGSKLSVTSAGIVTAVSGVVTYYGDGTNLTGVGDTANIITDSLNVSGNIAANGNIVGDTVTNISGINSVTANYYYGDGQYLINVGGGSVPGIDTTGTSTFENIDVSGNAGIGSLNVTGVSTFVGEVNIDGNILLDDPHILGFGTAGEKGSISHTSSNLHVANAVGDVYITTVDDDKDIKIQTDDGSGGLTNYFLADGSTGEAILYNYGTERIKTSGSGAIVSGILTATSFEGDGSNLSGIMTSGGLPGINTEGTSTFEDIVVNGYAGISTLNVTGITTLAGNIFLGHGGDSDQINVNGYFISGLVPLNGNSFDLGTPGKYWRNVFIDQTVVTNQINASGVITATSLDISGNVSIAGTLTYEDVTNVDSVGIITAGQGFRATAGGLVVAGVSTLGVVTGATYYGDGSNLSGAGVGTDGSINTTGIITATSFSGDGSGLTGITSEGMAGRWTDDAKGNLIAGTESGDNLNGFGCCNVLIGRAAGRGVTSGDCNILLGVGAGSSICTGDGNIILGDWAGSNIKTGNHNFLGGYRAAYCLGNTSCNIMIGYKAGYCTEMGSTNVFLGRNVGYGNTSGYHNVYAGDCAGCGQLCGAGNVALGYKALAGNSMPASNPYGGGSKYSIALGAAAGANDVSGCFNIYMGCNAGGLADITGSANQNNVHIGCASGCHLRGDCNVFLGALAGGCTGKDVSLGMGDDRIVGNTYLGASAGVGNTNGHNNVFLGSCAGATQITGSCNVVIGHNVGLAVTTGSNQLAIGSSSTNWLTGTSTGQVSFPEHLWANKKLLVNQTSSFAGNGKLQVAVTGSSGDAYGQAVDIFQYSSTAGCGAQLLFNRSKNATLGSYTDVADGDSLGRIVFRGYNDSYWNPGAEIEVVVDGTPSSGSDTSDMPGAIVLKTTPDDSATPAERFRVGPVGQWGIGGATYGASGQALISGGPSAAPSWGSVASGPDAQENVYLGTGAGADSDTDTCYNIGIGYSAAHNLNSGDTNVIIGKAAGYSITSGEHNTFLGCHAGYNSNGHCNFMAVNGAGCHNDTGANNVFIGFGAGQGTGASTKDASHNIAIGQGSGACLDQGDHNIFLGSQSGHCTYLGGGCNIFMGWCAGKANRSGNRNIVMGCSAYSASSSIVRDADDNVILGSKAAYELDKGHDNVFLGTCAGYALTTGHQNVGLGYSVGADLWGGSGNVLLGNQAGKNLTTGNCNIAIGRGTTFESATGDCQLVIGQCTGNWIVGDSSYNVTLAGIATVYSATGIVSATSFYGDGSFLSGIATTGEAGFSPDAQNNLYAGTGAGQASDGVTCCNVAIGYSAGYSLEGGDCNVLIGGATGYNLTSGNYNTFVGGSAGKCHCTGSFNVALGLNAGQRMCTGSFNTMIGPEAGFYSEGANCNVFLGHQSGYCSTGCRNTFLGRRAGKVTVSGSHNVAIGDEIELPILNGNYQLAIGSNSNYWITGDTSMNIGIGTTVPTAVVGSGNTAKLSVGIVSAYTFYGDGSNLTGVGGDTLISGITVQQGGVNVGSGGSITTINFIGDSVSGTASGDHGVDITITGGGTWVSNDTGIHTTANVAIGTTTATPAVLNLHAANSSNNDLIVFSAAGAASTERITIGSTTSDNGAISFEGSEGTLLSITNNLSSGSIFSVNDISGIPSIDVDADGTILLSPLVSSTVGYVGVGTNNPSTRLHVEGNAKFTGVVTATDFDSTSDIRLKTNIKPIDDPLSKVVQIEGVSFNWKQDNRPALGVIADQIEKVIPELVHGDDPKTVNYNGLVGLLIEVVKDQQTQIDDLNKRLSKLE